MATKLEELRTQYPQYNDLSDQQLADAFHDKYYSDMPKEEFYKTVGVASEAPQGPSENPLLTGTKKVARTLLESGSFPITAIGDFIAGTHNIGANLVGSDSRMKTLSQWHGEQMDQAGLPRPEGGLEEALYGGLGALTGAGVVNTAVKGANAGVNALVNTIPKAVATVAGGAAAPSSFHVIKDYTGSDLAATIGSLGFSSVVGGAAGKGAGKLSGESTPRLTMGEVRDRASAAYETVNQTGVSIRPASAQQIVGQARADLAAEGYRPRLHPQVDAVLATLTDDIGTQRVPFARMEQLRRTANELTTNTDPNIRRLGRTLIRSFDDSVSRLDTPDLMPVPGSNKAAFDEALQAVQSARRDWRASSRASVLEDVLDVAELNARKPTTSEAEAIRSGFIQLAKNKRKMAQFNPDEQEAIRAVSEGNSLDKVLGQVARLSPAHTPAALGYGGTMAGAGVLQSPKTALATAGVGAAGYAADKLQQVRRTAQARDVISQILSGQKPTPEEITTLNGLFGGAMNLQDQQ